MNIKKRKNLKYLSLCQNLSLVGIGVCVVALIFLYHQNLNSRKDANLLTEKTETLRLTNVELKNQLYAMLDSDNLAKLAENEALIKETNPRYLTLDTSSQEFIDIAQAIENSLEAVPAEPVVTIRLLAKNEN